MKRVVGSMTGQAWRTNSRRLRLASSCSISASSDGLASNALKLAEFLIGKLGQIGFDGELDRLASRARCTRW